jgi:hypothetical protein
MRHFGRNVALTGANIFRRKLCARIYKIKFWYEISRFKKKMPRRLLKVVAKRLILTCFETFVEANGKQLTMMNVANKVKTICAILLYVHFG